MSSLLAVFRRLTLVPQGTILVMAGFLPIFAIVSMFPALPSIIRHFADHPNARELVPLMVSAPGLAIAIMSPFAGAFVDRFGRIPLLVWSTFFYGIFGALPFFPRQPGPHLCDPTSARCVRGRHHHRRKHAHW